MTKRPPDTQHSSTVGPPPPPPAVIASREAFVTELGAALHAAGTPAHRLEDMLISIAAQLGIKAQIFGTPTSITAGFGELEDQRVVLVRVQPGEPNLERLDALDRLAGEVARGDTGIADARARLREITAAKRRYPGFLEPIAFSLASAAISIFFKGAYADILAAAIVGLLVGIFALIATKNRGLARLMEFAAGLVAAAAALALAAVIPGVTSKTVMISGLIVFVPGLTLTLAVNELATRHLVSGTARFSYALMILVAILFGAAVGLQFDQLLPSANTPTVTRPAPDWLVWIALLLIPQSLVVLFRAHPRDAWLITLASATAFLGARAGAALLGPELGASVGAFSLGILANGWARLARRPAAIPTIPGLMVLVPGAVGFRSLTALLEQDTAGGVATAFSMILVAASIVAGLLIAEVTLPSRQPL